MVVRPAALAALVLLLSAGVASAVDERAAQSYGIVDDVTYYMAGGMLNGSALATDAGRGERSLPFIGCGYLQLRPEFGRGRVTISGLVDGFTPIYLEMSEFSGGPAGSPGMVVNRTLDATLHPGLAPGQSVDVEAAGWGIAEMHAAEVPQPDGSILRGNFSDPISGEPDLAGFIVVQQDGARDDETGARLQGIDGYDDELRVLARSPPGAAPESDHAVIIPPGTLPDGSYAAEPEHAEAYPFLNSKFGGTGTVVFTSTSNAAPGFNELRVDVVAPDGTNVGNATVQSSLLGPGTATVEFPLDQLGLYNIQVAGKMLLGTYSVDLTQAPPASFQMEFWWEDVLRGNAARDGHGLCLRDLGLRSIVTAPSANRREPPSFPLELIVVATVAAAAVIMLLVKFINDAVSTSEFRKRFRK